MSELLCIARLKIHHRKLDEFKRLAVRCAELVRTKDTGTLQYELYFNSDNTECLVFERYRDSQALLDHHKNLGGHDGRDSSDMLWVWRNMRNAWPGTD
jgi:quinol monooxygenase YgiN